MNSMTDSIKFFYNHDYLLATISCTSITVERAQEILDLINQECSKIDCHKVLLDERTVEIRKVPPPEIMKLSHDIEAMTPKIIHIAFWCKSHLINKDSSLLSAFTFNEEYVVKHFTNKDDAISWLNS